MKMEAVHSLETTVNFYQTIRILVFILTAARTSNFKFLISLMNAKERQKFLSSFQPKINKILTSVNDPNNFHMKFIGAPQGSRFDKIK
jgi:hypothetical protein